MRSGGDQPGQRGLATKSVRDPAEPADGRRILVDRLWPRGVSRERAQLSEWRVELAPSTELRKWFDHDPARWQEFRHRYRSELELSGRLAQLGELRQQAQQERITLLFGASDGEHNNAVALLALAAEL